MSDSPSHPHSYGTRIRNNSILKPSTRLRQSPPPRRIKPSRNTSQPPSQPHNHLQYPLFPIPNVMLHPDDAASKVFHAIGRCFLSVDNRAMTIKDLAEMTLNFGLMCQNVSAASQAITTYIRNHLARCEAQQDHPLLLRHMLSGTPTDDDLIPALHSRVGGATLQRQTPCNDASNQNIPSGRHTNFRRGTIVWYLSKASGVSCPFSRAGILLSNYLSPSSITNPKVREKCGDKRKRLISRRCRAPDHASVQSTSPAPSSSPVDSGYAESSSSSSAEEEEEPERPPKVKLTLRLRPSPPCPSPSTPNDVIDLSNDTSSSEDEDVQMSSPTDLNLQHTVPEQFCLPPYPRRSIAVPSYTPVSPTTCASLQYVFPPPPMEPFRPSASPPPDSDREDECDFDFECSSDEDESRGVSVKVEDVDDVIREKNVRDMLEAWEDLDLDRARSYSCPEIGSGFGFAFVARENDNWHGVAPKVKVEELEMWEWEFETGWAGACGEVDVKKEDVGDFLSPAHGPPLSPTNGLPLSPWNTLPLSPMSPLTPSPRSSTGGFTFHFSPTLSHSPGDFPTGASSPSAHPLEGPAQPPLVTPTQKPFFERKNSVLDWQDAELLGPDSVHIAELELEWAGRKRFACPASSPASSSFSSEDAQMADLGRVPEPKERVVVHTCVPCEPPVSATQVEGIPVYQTTLPLGPPHAQTRRTLLRRLDTDFVNLTPLLAAFSACPCPSFPSSVVRIGHPNPAVAGVWVPLEWAQQFLDGQPLSGNAEERTLRASVEVFLNDELAMRFPSALRDFWRASKAGRMLGQFGLCFEGGVVGPVIQPITRPVCNGALSPSPPLVSSGHETTSAAQSSSPLIRIECHSPPPPECQSSSSSLSSRAAEALSVRRDEDYDVWNILEDAEPVLPAFDLTLAALASGLGTSLEGTEEPRSANGELPLSPTEAEMFRVLCVCPDWEEKEVLGENDDKSGDCGGNGRGDIEHDGEGDGRLNDRRSLRRSKRVADAAARTRVVRSGGKSGPRHG